MLKYLFLGQIIRRNAKKIDLIEPRIDDINTIIAHFEAHFSQIINPEVNLGCLFWRCIVCIR